MYLLLSADSLTDRVHSLLNFCGLLCGLLVVVVGLSSAQGYIVVGLGWLDLCAIVHIVYGPVHATYTHNGKCKV